MKLVRKLRRLANRILISEAKPVLTLPQLAWVRERHGIQIEPVQLLQIIQTLRPPANFLVFGLGNDSAFWVKRNPGGRTVFLESDPAWFARITQKHPLIEAHLVSYDTQRKDWEQLLAAPEKLHMDLPPAVSGTRWDVILVDAPPGYEDTLPGRMKSIYMASRLIKPGGDVFLHDCNRQVERAYADKFLRSQNLASETGLEILRHYRMPA